MKNLLVVGSFFVELVGVGEVSDGRELLSVVTAWLHVQSGSLAVGLT
ncbi:hypothetical protein ACOZ9X_00305 [Fictibacillus nanhaiensis]